VTHAFDSRHQTSPDVMTDHLFNVASMTGVTDESGIENKCLVTGDRLSLSSPLYARTGEGNREQAANASPDTAALPLMPTDRYITNRAQLGRCRTCNRPIIRADIGFQIIATVDPTYLSALQELEAIVAGEQTYELKPDQPTVSGIRHLGPRFLSEIRWHPNRALPEHRCERPRTHLDLHLLDGTLLGHPWRQPKPVNDHDAIDQPTEGSPF
jgi:hypothetical protein